MLAESKHSLFSRAELERAREQERQQQLKLLKKQKNKVAAMRRDRFAMLALVLSVLILCFSYVIIESKIYNCGYQTNQIKAEISQTQTKIERLGLEVESLSSMERIAPYAIANLGMVYPTQNDVSYIDYQAIDTGLAMASAEAIKIEVLPTGEAKQSYISPFLEALEKLVSNYFYSSAALAAK